MELLGESQRPEVTRVIPVSAGGSPVPLSLAAGLRLERIWLLQFFLEHLVSGVFYLLGDMGPASWAIPIG